MLNGILHDCEQRTDEWRALRLGRLTASNAAEMLATIKSGEAAARRNLRVRLMLERVTGRSQESTFQSEAMRQGSEREADACGLYEALTGRVTFPVGFISHATLMAGCSPDAAVGDFEGLVEAKCCLAATHLDYLKSGVVPDEYRKQVIHQLWLTGAQWCDWISYHPEFPEPLRMKLVRIVRDEAQIKSYELLARNFLREVDDEVAAVQAMASSATTGAAA